MKKITSILVVMLTVTALSNQIAFAANKIILSPGTSSITEGQSRIIGIQLESSPGAPVTLDITSSNPESVNILPNSITFAANEWDQTKLFTVSVPLNGTYGDTHNVLIIARASSASQPYNGIAGAASVHVTDTTTEPDTSPPQDPPTDTDDPTNESDPSNQDTSQTQEDAGLTSDPSDPYARLSQTSSFGPDDINLNGSKDSNQSNFHQFTDGLIPGKTSTLRTATTYTLVILVINLAVVGVVYVRRKSWWQRQEARDVRWYYRHRKLKRPKLTKKNLKLKKRKR